LGFAASIQKKQQKIMKKTYRSPRLTEYGTASEVRKAFGFQGSDESTAELEAEVLVSSKGAAATNSETPVAVE
jgi:hypothetical protein